MNNVLLNSSIPISLVGSREVVEGSPSKRKRLLLALDDIFGSRQIARQIIDELGLDRYEPVVVLHLRSESASLKPSAHFPWKISAELAPSFTF